ncbi:hypothetical protein PG999_003054 [Apiospora kogelbergensis]|uniref:Ankyrin repeat-containing protein n=1 Tax=Apiospora kogelbergensis TaxID=1337665 RepID=A0AAW0R9V8_9PEZI
MDEIIAFAFGLMSVASSTIFYLQHAFRSDDSKRKILPERLLRIYDLAPRYSSENNGVNMPGLVRVWTAPPSADEPLMPFTGPASQNHIRICVGQDIDFHEPVLGGSTAQGETAVLDTNSIAAHTQEQKRRGAFGLASLPPEYSSTRSRRGYSAICEQWLSNPSDVWWESTSSLSVKGRSSLFGLSKKFPGPVFARVGGSLDFAKSLIQVLRRVWITWDSAYEMLIMVVACSSEDSFQTRQFSKKKPELDSISAEAVRASFETYVKKLSDYSSTYQYLLSGDALDTVGKRKILLIWHSQIQLHAWTKSIEMIRTSYTEVRESLLDGRKFAMRSHLIDEIANDAYYYKELSFHAKEFTTAVESLLRSFAACYSDTSSDLQWQQGVRGIIAEMQGLCSSLNVQVDEIGRNLDHHLKYLELRRGIQEGNGLWILSIVASIFLPLSLASSILSMQTRFVNLGTLLYDFCGVVVLLITFVGFVIVVVRISASTGERLDDINPYPMLKKVLKAIIALSALFVWAIVLASFIVGMVQDLGMGALQSGISLLWLSLSLHAELEHLSTKFGLLAVEDSQRSEKPLQFLCRKHLWSLVSVVGRLIPQVVNMVEDGNHDTALSLAVRDGQVGLVKILLGAEAEQFPIDTPGSSAQILLDAGGPDIVKKFIANSSNSFRPLGLMATLPWDPEQSPAISNEGTPNEVELDKLKAASQYNKHTQDQEFDKLQLILSKGGQIPYDNTYDGTDQTAAVRQIRHKPSDDSSEDPWLWAMHTRDGTYANSPAEVFKDFARWKQFTLLMLTHEYPHREREVPSPSDEDIVLFKQWWNIGSKAVADLKDS